MANIRICIFPCDLYSISPMICFSQKITSLHLFTSQFHPFLVGFQATKSLSATSQTHFSSPMALFLPPRPGQLLAWQPRSASRVKVRWAKQTFSSDMLSPHGPGISRSKKLKDPWPKGKKTHTPSINLHKSGE